MAWWRMHLHAGSALCPRGDRPRGVGGRLLPGNPDSDTCSDARDKAMALDRFNDVLAVSLEEVQDNFRRYDLLDDQVATTLPPAPIGRLAVMRLDGDLYWQRTS